MTQYWLMVLSWVDKDKLLCKWDPIGGGGDRDELHESIHEALSDPDVLCVLKCVTQDRQLPVTESLAERYGMALTATQSCARDAAFAPIAVRLPTLHFHLLMKEEPEHEPSF